MPERPDLLTAKELAEELRCSLDHVYRLARDGRIPTYKLGRSHRFVLAEVMDAMSEREPAA